MCDKDVIDHSYLTKQDGLVHTDGIRVSSKDFKRERLA